MTTEPPIDVPGLFSIAGKTALVTGGSRGIGLMITRGYVEAGARVYISSRKAEACEAVAESLNAASRKAGWGGECLALPADLANEAGWQGLATELAAREKSLHILVNNAGANWGAPLEEFPAQAFDRVFDLNVKAIFMLTQGLLPLLEAAAMPGDPARVINIGSIDGIRVPTVDNYAYSASKAALHQMTRVLAVKLGGRNITTNAVAPGPFASKMTEWWFDNQMDEILAACPLGRIGQPTDMAGIAIYLASRAGAYLNGTIIPVDGGITVQP